MRPTLILPCSCYHYLSKVLPKFFEKKEGENIKTNSVEALQVLKSLSLEPTEIVFISRCEESVYKVKAEN